MRLYADSAHVRQVTRLLEDRLIVGVTTNPTILHQQGLGASDIPELYRKFTDAGAQEIFFQATGASRLPLTESAKRIADLGPGVIVKVPATADGFRVAAVLASSGTEVLLTAVYSVAQAAVSAAIGARYIAPYFGRLADVGQNALALVSEMHTVVSDTHTDVLVASVRSAEVTESLALIGIRHVTANPAVIDSLLVSRFSEEAAAEFERLADQSRP